MGLLFSATCYFLKKHIQELSYEQPVCLLSARFYVSERPQPPSLNAENKSISSVGCFISRAFFLLLPFRPVSTKPYGSWEKERNELYFQILTKGAVVSKRPMNAWDTVVYRRASSRHWGLKGRLMELPLLKQRNIECFCYSCRPPSSTPTLTTSFPSLLGAKIPLAILMTYGWRKKCVAGQERHKVSILSINFWYLYHKKQESQQRLCSSCF